MYGKNSCLPFGVNVNLNLSNKGWDHWEGFGRWERKGRVMGVLKGWKEEEIGENYPAMLKMYNRKMAK